MVIWAITQKQQKRHYFLFHKAKINLEYYLSLLSKEEKASKPFTRRSVPFLAPTLQKHTKKI